MNPDEADLDERIEAVIERAKTDTAQLGKVVLAAGRFAFDKANHTNMRILLRQVIGLDRHVSGDNDPERLSHG